MWEHSGVIPIVFVPKAVPHLGEKQGRPRLRIKSANSTNQKVGSPILSAARRAVSHGGSTHRRKHIRKQSQHVNGVADSLPSGSGYLAVQLEVAVFSDLFSSNFPANREKCREYSTFGRNLCRYVPLGEWVDQKDLVLTRNRIGNKHGMNRESKIPDPKYGTRCSGILDSTLNYICCSGSVSLTAGMN
jgi:hypothetical protein